MWLLGSSSQVMMMMDERLSPSARSVQSPGDNTSTIHSIEAILGFKEDTLFYKSAAYNMTEKAMGKDAERNGNVIVTPMKKSHSAESFDSKLLFLSSISGKISAEKCNYNVVFLTGNLSLKSFSCHLDTFIQKCEGMRLIRTYLFFYLTKWL